MFQTPSTRWTALQTRNPDAHTAFVYAVLSTRIYCRPDCIARLARRANVIFYDSAAEASAAGHRACKRCKPEMPAFHPQADAVRKACEAIASEARGGRELGLQELATRVGVTKCHLHRVFRARMGVTPREWGVRCRAGVGAAVREGKGGWGEEGRGREGAQAGEPGFAAASPLELDGGRLTESMSPASYPEPDTPFDVEDPMGQARDVSDSWSGLFLPDLEELDLGPLHDATVLADFDFATQHAPSLAPPRQHVLFTIRLCSVGYLLVAFHAPQVCMLKIAGSADELLPELFAKCDELGCGYLDLCADESEDERAGVDAESKAAYLGYVDGVVESLGRPLAPLGKLGAIRRGPS